MKYLSKPSKTPHQKHFEIIWNAVYQQSVPEISLHFLHSLAILLPSYVIFQFPRAPVAMLCYANMLQTLKHDLSFKNKADLYLIFHGMALKFKMFHINST